MIADVRAQVDLIASLHLEEMFKMEHLERARDQGNRMTHVENAIPHSREHDPVQLRHRMTVIQSLALRAQGLTIKSDMAQYASTRRKETVSSQSPANIAAKEDIYRRQCLVAMINEGGYRSH